MLRSIIPSVLLAAIAVVSIHLGAGAGDQQTPRPGPDELAKFLAASRTEHDERVTWEAASEWTFDDGVLPETFRVLDGDWRVVEGRLVAVDGKPERNRTILLCPCPGDRVRISFDVMLQSRAGDRIGDVGIRFADPQTGSFARHYAMITGQYYNQATVCYRRNIPIARTEWSPLRAGQTHQVVLEYTRIHLRYWVDGRIVLEAWDRDAPIDVAGTWLGINTYDSVMTLDNIRIETGTPVAKR